MKAEYEPSEVKDTIRRLVADIGELEPEEVSDQAKFIDDLEMDSLMGLEFIVQLEKRFGIKFSESEMISIDCPGKASALVLAKLDA